MYIQIKARKIHFVSGSIWLQGYNVHRNKSKENTFCVRLNPAPRLQYAKQMKMKYNQGKNTLKVNFKNTIYLFKCSN